MAAPQRLLDPTVRLARGDFDADGSPDLLVGNDGQNRLYLNDGTAVFRDATAGLPAGGDPRHHDSGDR